MSRYQIEHYTLDVDVKGGLPSMQWLVDLVADGLERKLNLDDTEYAVVVHGPPEMRIVAVDRA